MEITENPAIQYILVFQIHLRGFRQDIFSLTGNFILFPQIVGKFPFNRNMNFCFGFASDPIDLMMLEIRLTQVGGIPFDFLPAECGDISKPQTAGDTDREQAPHQRRGIFENQFQFLF